MGQDNGPALCWQGRSSVLVELPTGTNTTKGRPPDGYTVFTVCAGGLTGDLHCSPKKLPKAHQRKDDASCPATDDVTSLLRNDFHNI